MEESKALHKLVEAQDLVGMIETMLSPEMTEKLPPSAWSGVRITLRTIREMIGTSHASMANDFVQRSKNALVSSSTASSAAMVTGDRAFRQENLRSTDATKVDPARAESPIVQSSTTMSADNIRANPGLSRRDLKASLERLVDRA